MRAASLVHRLDRIPIGKASSRLRPPRYFVTDHGLVSALSHGRHRSPATNAHLVETVVFRHLREVAKRVGATLSYFRDANSECDFIIDGPDHKTAIEVTTSGHPAKKLQNLHRIADGIGADRSFVIHTGLEETDRSGIRLLPLHRFLLRPESVLAAQEPGS